MKKYYEYSYKISFICEEIFYDVSERFPVELIEDLNIEGSIHFRNFKYYLIEWKEISYEEFINFVNNNEK